MTNDDYSAAAKALQDWCLHQDLAPAEALMVCHLFIAKMIAANATSADNVETKLVKCDKSIRKMLVGLALGDIR